MVTLFIDIADLLFCDRIVDIDVQRQISLSPFYIKQNKCTLHVFEVSPKSEEILLFLSCILLVFNVFLRLGIC